MRNGWRSRCQTPLQSIIANPALTSLEGLQGITEVGRRLNIQRNATLPTFDNLESLHTYLRSSAP